jgi:hypothetical protein
VPQRALYGVRRNEDSQTNRDTGTVRISRLLITLQKMRRRLKRPRDQNRFFAKLGLTRNKARRALNEMTVSERFPARIWGGYDLPPIRNDKRASVPNSRIIGQPGTKYIWEEVANPYTAAEKADRRSSPGRSRELRSVST